jgi:hypothetical protein
MIFSSLNFDFFTEFLCRKTLLLTGPDVRIVRGLQGRGTASTGGVPKRGSGQIRAKSSAFSLRGGREAGETQLGGPPLSDGPQIGTTCRPRV